MDGDCGKVCSLCCKKLGIQKHTILIIVSQPLPMVWTPGQSIRLIESTGFMDDGESKAGEEEGPVGLSPGEFLFLGKVDQITVVSPDLEGLWAAFQVMAKNFQGMDDSQEFLIVNFVVSFCWLKGFKMVGNQMPTIKGIRLFKNGPGGEITSISEKAEGLGVVQ